MPSLHPLTQDALVLALGVAPKDRLTLRKGALAMLLDPPEGVRPARVALQRGRDHEAGDVTLSRAGRNLQFRVHDPPRLFLASAEKARRFLRGELAALPLVDATDEAPGKRAQPSEDAEEEAARKRREHAERLRALVAKRLDPEEKT